MILKKLKHVSRIKTSVTKRIWRRRRNVTRLGRQMYEFYTDLGAEVPVSIDILASGEAKALFTGISGRKYPLTVAADVTDRLAKISAVEGVPIGQVMLHALIEYFSGAKSRAR